MKIQLLVMIILLTVNMNLAQPYQKHDKNPRERMEQLEKLKLLEALDLNEEEAIRFIARRNEFRDEHKELIQKRDEIILNIELAIGKNKAENEVDYQKKIEEFLTIEEKLIHHRAKFLNSLEDILTQEQIAKLIVFELKFKQEIRDLIIKRRGRK
ncbi:MAG TPA: hypothetical protein ENN33_08820 [Ignavibacteria bacterium]|nr:hypothetical protein [Ignavibacteria bacterium]